MPKGDKESRGWPSSCLSAHPVPMDQAQVTLCSDSNHLVPRWGVRISATLESADAEGGKVSRSKALPCLC